MQLKNKVFVLVLSVFLLLPLLSAMTTNSQVQGGLPVRPTAVPTTAPPTSAQKGGLITLDLSPSEMSYWTQVQWQDTETGEWHDVDGWQGSTNASGDVTWWVAPSDLSKGPFRWQVFLSESDSTANMTSDTFNLPTENRVVVVTISEE